MDKESQPSNEIGVYLKTLRFDKISSLKKFRTKLEQLNNPNDPPERAEYMTARYGHNLTVSFLDLEKFRKNLVEIMVDLGLDIQ